MMHVLSLDIESLRARARRLRLVLSDVDGVQTDAGVYYGEHGEVLKRFSVRDGMGVERLRNVGVKTAFMTRERSPSVERRAEKLRLPHCFLGIIDKEARLTEICQELGLELGDLAYIGDDVNDLGVIRIIGELGLTAAPSDAIKEVRESVHHVTLERGGYGAFRDFAEWLIGLRGTEQ